MSIVQLALIGVILGMLWSLTKIAVAVIDLLGKLISMAIVLSIALMLLVTLLAHSKPG